jgi:hypothetical protein
MTILKNMEKKTYRDYFYTEEAYTKHKIKIDKKIETYNNGFMSNSKWKKLFLKIFSNIYLIKYCEVVDFFSSSIITLKTNLGNIDPKKYIHSDCIDNILFETGEHTVSYREIEYLEFKKHWKSKESGKSGNYKIKEQDTNKIKETLEKTGQYEWEETEEYLRIIGYK